jgi:hypothetical protein
MLLVFCREGAAQPALSLFCMMRMMTAHLVVVTITQVSLLLSLRVIRIALA